MASLPDVKVGNWNFSWSRDDGAYTLTLDLEAVVRRMNELEEEATREALIGWLRANGYTVEKNDAA